MPKTPSSGTPGTPPTPGEPTTGTGSGPLPFSPVTGTADGSDAVTGQTNTGVGVRGISASGTGVSGESNSGGIGILGWSDGGAAVIAQADSTGVGLLALGSYTGSILSFSGGNFPTAVTDLINANKGYAAILSGMVKITDALNAASATFSGEVQAASATLSGELQAASGAFGGALNVGGQLTTASATVSGVLNAASGVFTGPVNATDVVLTGADCAEEFDLADDALEPGSVAVIAEGGTLAHTTIPYDRRVAGVISGAGTFRPAVILDRRPGTDSRAPVALVGKVYCKVDAEYGTIAAGDLLTTSPTAGYAMKASDPDKSLGAVIGKALAAHARGQGLIPMLVTLR